MQDLDINSTAARWDARLRSHRCTDSDRAAFKAWCDADARHRQTFDRLQLALGALRAAADHPQVRALREQATLAQQTFPTRRVAWAAVAAVAVCVVAVVFFLHGSLPLVTIAQSPASVQNGDAQATLPNFATDSDELRTVNLPDGSSVTLNAGTQIETQWLPKERRVRLLTGQAMFQVAKDKTRPFIVTAGDRTVTALGTAFDVKVDVGRVQVTLVEGRVAVRGLGKAMGQPTVELAPHEQLIAKDGGAPTVRSVDVATTTGWAEEQVYFTDESLANAALEMNRHSAEQIVIGDDAIAQYRVNGMFRAGNQRGFVNALSLYYPIEYRRDDEGRIVLTQRREEVRTE